MNQIVPVTPVPPEGVARMDSKEAWTEQNGKLEQNGAGTMEPSGRDSADSAGDKLEDEGMSLETSVWDVSLLVGLSHNDYRLLTNFQSTIAILLTLSNIVMQAFVTVAVENAMAVENFTPQTKDAVLTERLFQNHRFNNLDFSKLETKTHQLCLGRVMNFMETQHSDIKTYLSEYPFGIEGLVVATLAMTIWILSMTTECRRVAELMYALLSLPMKQKRKASVVFNEEEDVYMIVRLDWKHRIWNCTVLSARGVMSCFLLAFGLQWLAGTIAVSDLILNACALEIVKGMDELLFDALFGYDVRLLVESTRIAHKPMRKRGELCGPISWENLMLTVRGIWAGVWVVIARECFLKTTYDDAVEVRGYLCEGNQDFVYDTHPVIGLPFFANVHKDLRSDQGENETNGTVRVIDAMQCSYAAIYDMLLIRGGFKPSYFKPGRELTQRLAGTAPSCLPHGDVKCPEISLSEMATLQSESSEGFYETPSSCQDMDVHMEVLRATCLNETYKDLVPWFRSRENCSAFTDICSCPGEEMPDGSTMPMRDCASGNFTDIIREHGIIYEWIEMLQKYCPRSCNRCEDPPEKKEDMNSHGMQGGKGGDQQGMQGGMQGGANMSGMPQQGSSQGGMKSSGGMQQQGGTQPQMEEDDDDLDNETDDNSSKTSGRCVCTWIADSGSSGFAASQGGDSEGSTAQSGSSQDGASQGGASQSSPSESSDSQSSASQSSASQSNSSQSTSSQSSSSQSGSSQSSASQSSASQSSASQNSASQSSSSETSASQSSPSQSTASQGSTSGTGPSQGGRRLVGQLAYRLDRLTRQTRVTNAALRTERKELLEEQRLLRQQNLKLEERVAALQEQLQRLVSLTLPEH